MKSYEIHFPLMNSSRTAEFACKSIINKMLSVCFETSLSSYFYLFLFQVFEQDIVIEIRHNGCKVSTLRNSGSFEVPIVFCAFSHKSSSSSFRRWRFCENWNYKCYREWLRYYRPHIYLLVHLNIEFIYFWIIRCYWSSLTMESIFVQKKYCIMKLVLTLSWISMYSGTKNTHI